ncbi:MAG TPA: transporter [Caulobacteraceae bacterium]|nr:transporter [Caulobacteraceae bacterium]
MVATAAPAQDAGDTSAAGALRPLCTDRPTKSTAPCTVDPGHLQIESDIINFTYDHEDGVTTDTWLITNPTVKFGLTRTLDIEANLTPWIIVEARSAGQRTTQSGVGDLFLRAKWNFVGADGGKVAIALSPFVKLPTASGGVGNGAVEAGAVVPVSLTLPAGWAVTFDPELDVLKDQQGEGRHVALAGLASFSRALSKTVTGSVEIWSATNFDPGGRVTQVSGDIGVAWIPTRHPNFQLDGGANFGLNRTTPAAQVYIGASRRF